MPYIAGHFPQATNFRALLRKMTYEDKASYGSSPPCSELTFENMYFLQNIRKSDLFKVLTGRL